jgi:hypothetical protein
MRAELTRVLVFLVCVVFGVGGVSSRAAAADTKKKSWPSKKHHKTHHKASKPAKAAGAKASAAPAEDADEDEGDDSAEDDQKDQKDDAAKAKTKTKAKPSGEEGAREASDDKGKDDDGEGEGDAGVVRRKAGRSTADEGGAAPVAFEIAAGSRAVHRTFDFNDPLSNYNQAVAKPYSYTLPAGPVPFVELGLYPAAFATRGFAANIGLVARYEKLMGTKTAAADGSTFSTLGQQLEVGARGRLPLGAHEVGLSATYGKQAFHVSATDPGPGAGSTLPNVDYTFAGVGADARLRLAPLELGAHVGTRFVFDTGSLGKNWFPTTKTTSIEAGVSVGYQLSSLFAVIAGADFLRYAFDFNPIPPTNPLIAGGAVDQYISGFLALRVSISGG